MACSADEIVATACRGRSRIGDAASRRAVLHRVVQHGPQDLLEPVRITDDQVLGTLADRAPWADPPAAPPTFGARTAPPGTRPGPGSARPPPGARPPAAGPPSAAAGPPGGRSCRGRRAPRRRGRGSGAAPPPGPDARQRRLQVMGHAAQEVGLERRQPVQLIGLGRAGARRAGRARSSLPRAGQAGRTGPAPPATAAAAPSQGASRIARSSSPAATSTTTKAPQGPTAWRAPGPRVRPPRRGWRPSGARPPSGAASPVGVVHAGRQAASVRAARRTARFQVGSPVSGARHRDHRARRRRAASSAMGAARTCAASSAIWRLRSSSAAARRRWASLVISSASEPPARAPSSTIGWPRRQIRGRRRRPPWRPTAP